MSDGDMLRNFIEVLDAYEAARKGGEDTTAAMDAKITEQDARARRRAAELGVPFDEGPTKAMRYLFSCKVVWNAYDDCSPDRIPNLIWPRN